jgi:hypothetical protein
VTIKSWIIRGLIGLTLVLGLLAVGINYWWGVQRAAFLPEQLTADLALQDEGAIKARVVKPVDVPPNFADLEMYFGDLHVHTDRSFDSRLFGNQNTPEDAYRFSRGEPLTTAGGEVMRLSAPLDFVAITDHAEGFGALRGCDDPSLPLRAKFNCFMYSTPNAFTFRMARRAGQAVIAEASRADAPSCKATSIEFCMSEARADWADFIALADDYNEPGVFTTFAAYEYSPPLPERGKIHRNVFFNGSQLPSLALSMFDVSTASDLWQQLSEQCLDNCDFITIPHNMNLSWGLAYGDSNIQGESRSKEDWLRRAQHEPLAEIYQIKGNSECAFGVGNTDEECSFEQPVPACEDGQTMGCATRTSFFREALKRGFELEQTIGLNPLKIGVVAATDAHNGNPGDVEEYDYRGTAGAFHSPANRRLAADPKETKGYRSNFARSPGGITAVWAANNTRDDIFEALKSRRAYGTSGPRIGLTFSASWTEEANQSSPTAPPSEQVLMGATLLSPARPATTEGAESSPMFEVSAFADPLDAPLSVIQIVKVWFDGNESHERVTDIACSNNRQIDKASDRCLEDRPVIDLKTCEYGESPGARSLEVRWRDPNYQPDVDAAYYVRVLQNPTCRWSTYDAMRLGRETPASLPKTVRERAWSSPIWVPKRSS